MPRGSKPGERRGGRERGIPNRRTILTDRILAVAAQHPKASWCELVIELTKDQKLPVDTRIAIARACVARSSRSAASRGPRSRSGAAIRSAAITSQGIQEADGSARVVKTMSEAVLDVVFGIAKEVAAAPKVRRNAALRLAQFLLPEMPGRSRWRGAVPDEYGFVISPRMAKEYRDAVRELQHLRRSGASNTPTTMKNVSRLQAVIKDIERRLQCPCPTRYGRSQFENDLLRKGFFRGQHQAKIVLSEEQDAAEAHVLARLASFDNGPEEAAKTRFRELEEKKRYLGRTRGRPLPRKEQVELRFLRVLYSRAKSSDLPPDEFYYYPFRDEMPAWDGNFYPPDSKRRPPEPDDYFVEFGECEPIVYSNPNYPPYTDPDPPAENPKTNSEPPKSTTS